MKKQRSIGFPFFFKLPETGALLHKYVWLWITDWYVLFL